MVSSRGFTRTLQFCVVVLLQSRAHSFLPGHVCGLLPAFHHVHHKVSCGRLRSFEPLCLEPKDIDPSELEPEPEVPKNDLVNSKPSPGPQNKPCTSVLLTEFAKDLSRLSELRPAVPSADFSAPRSIISAGRSSYTRIWTPDTWKRHTLSYPHIRYLRHLMRWKYSTTAQKVFPSTMIAGAYALILSVIIQVSGGCMISASKGASAALGALSAPLALLLTLRTNAALGRLNETRLAWGRLVLYTRSMGALLRTHVLQSHPEAAVLAARHVAIFGWLLKSSLRGEDKKRELEVMQAVFEEDSSEYQWLAAHPRPVWGIAVRLRQIVAAVASNEDHNFLIQHGLLEQAIENLEGVAGVCERILASPIPPTYSRHLSRVLTIWLAVLPIGLIGSCIPVLGTVFATAFTSYVLIGLDEIGMEIEYPFSLLPLQQLAGAAQQGVGMQLMDNDCTEELTGEVMPKMPPVPL